MVFWWHRTYISTFSRPDATIFSSKVGYSHPPVVSCRGYSPLDNGPTWGRTPPRVCLILVNDHLLECAKSTGIGPLLTQNPGKLANLLQFFLIFLNTDSQLLSYKFRDPPKVLKGCHLWQSPPIVLKGNCCSCMRFLIHILPDFISSPLAHIAMKRWLPLNASHKKNISHCRHRGRWWLSFSSTTFSPACGGVWSRPKGRSDSRTSPDTPALGRPRLLPPKGSRSCTSGALRGGVPSQVGPSQPVMNLTMGLQGPRH